MFGIFCVWIRGKKGTASFGEYVQNVILNGVCVCLSSLLLAVSAVFQLKQIFVLSHFSSVFFYPHSHLVVPIRSPLAHFLRFLLRLLLRHSLMFLRPFKDRFSPSKEVKQKYAPYEHGNGSHHRDNKTKPQTREQYTKLNFIIRRRNSKMESKTRNDEQSVGGSAGIIGKSSSKRNSYGAIAYLFVCLLQQ